MPIGDTATGRAGKQLFSGRALIWFQFVLATPVVLWIGQPLFERAWASIVKSETIEQTAPDSKTGHAMTGC